MSELVQDIPSSEL